MYPLIRFFKRAYETIKSIFGVIFTVGKFIFKTVEWLTKPSGVIAKVINFCLKAYFLFKKILKWIFKATGKNSIDMLCMFLSGDTIGLAIAMIGGLVKRAWQFLKNLHIFKLIFAYIKAVFTVWKMILTI